MTDIAELRRLLAEADSTLSAANLRMDSWQQGTDPAAVQARYFLETAAVNALPGLLDRIEELEDQVHRDRIEGDTVQRLQKRIKELES